ncbi:EH signature domain-containing protein [Isoptericola haloaureus]|uniref:EH signature domain-containing protein n=1 Tax=Isoptericola haloaureus TaxID=1542902 RepID=A0ABU7Z8E8_9MICO
MTLALPAPEVRREAWSRDLTEQWHDAGERAAEIARRAGTGYRYPPLLAEAQRLLEHRDTRRTVERMRDRLFTRAVCEWWATDERLAQRSMTPAVLEAVGQPERRASRLATTSLITALLGYFDRLDDWEEGRLEAVGSAVDRAVRGCRRRDHVDVVEIVRSSPHYVTSADGPHALARDLIRDGRRLETDPVASALCQDDRGRFAQMVRNEYYLGLIEAADHTSAHHDFLHDATDRATALRRDDNDHRFGIAVLRGLCDKPDTVVPSAAWVDAVLRIGGDPRHEQSSSWHDWWSHLEPALRQRAVRWMSGADLRAFLDAVRVYGDETANTSLQRMYPRRRRFLMGLYESGLVQDTRLILGSNIRPTVKRVTDVSLAGVAQFSDQARDTAIVLVDCGEFHLIEGSHNFKLHAYIGPPGPEITDSSRRHFTRTYLNSVLPQKHCERHPKQYEAYRSWTHDPGGNWTGNALDFLRGHGIHLDASALLDDRSLAKLARRRTTTTSGRSWRRR